MLAEWLLTSGWHIHSQTIIVGTRDNMLVTAIAVSRGGRGLGQEINVLAGGKWLGLPCSSTSLGFVYFFVIFILERCGDMQEFSIHIILLNPLKYSSPKILYHNGELESF
jgi:hypothetical protein